VFKYHNDDLVTCFSSVGKIRAAEKKRRRDIALSKNENRMKQEMLLVEFKAPRELVEAFDTKMRSKFSNRSEAIRSLMRTFLEATTEGS